MTKWYFFIEDYPANMMTSWTLQDWKTGYLFAKCSFGPDFAIKNARITLETKKNVPWEII